MKEGRYRGVMFATQKHLDSLKHFGICAFTHSKKEAEANPPDIGDYIHLLFDETSRGRRIAVRLLANQKRDDGGVISIYVPAYYIFTENL